jgi:hypothetical protein
LQKAGYRPREATLELARASVTRAEWSLDPLENGILLSRKIALDYPEKDDRAERIVRILESLLREAGANVIIPPDLQRESEEERTLYINRTGADFLLTLDSRPESWESGRVGYYYNSREGRRLAGDIGSVIDRGIRESSHFLIIHTGMPAARVPLSEETDAEAYARRLYLGIVSYLAGTPEGSLPS